MSPTIHIRAKVLFTFDFCVLQLTGVLSELGVPAAEIQLALSPGTARAAQNAAQTEKGRLLCGGSVPKFLVTCGGDSADVAAATSGSPTSPDYFERIFEACDKRAAGLTATPLRKEL